MGQEPDSRIYDPIPDPPLTQLGRRQNLDTEGVLELHDPIDPISRKKGFETIPESDFSAEEIGEYEYLADDE